MIYLKRVFKLFCQLFYIIWKIFLIFGVTPIVFGLQFLEPLIVYPFYFIKTGRNYWDYYHCIMDEWMGYVVYNEKMKLRKDYMFDD